MDMYAGGRTYRYELSLSVQVLVDIISAHPESAGTDSATVALASGRARIHTVHAYSTPGVCMK